MTLSRRDFLCGSSSAIALMAVVPSHAWVHGSAASSGFNGGKSQVNFNFLLGGGEYPFIDALKTAQSWSFSGLNAAVTPDMLDSNGWPVSIPATVITVTFVPSQSARPGNYVVTWTGNGTIGFNMTNTVLPTATFTGSVTSGVLTAGSPTGGTIQKGMTLSVTGVIGNQLTGTTGGAGTYQVIGGVNAGSQSMTVSGGSKIGSGGSGRYVFSTSDFRFDFRIGTGVNVTNAKIFHVNDEADLNAGQVFSSYFKARITEANFGVLRFLNWMGNSSGGGNTTNMTTWSARKPINHWSYEAFELRQSLYAGATGSTGRVYSVSAPSIHSSDGTTWSAGQSPKNGDTVLAKITNSATATISAAVSSGVTTVLTIPTSAPNANFNLVGETVIISGISGSWSSMNGNRTVTAASSGSVTISFDSSALTPGGLAGSALVGHQLCSLDVAASGTPINILNQFSQALNDFSYPIGGTFQSLATFVFNSTLNAWIKQGADSSENSVGINGGAPIELMIRLCIETGAHPWLPAPFMACTPMTDWHQGLAAYCLANCPNWMIPRFEVPNELWNFQFQSTFFAGEIGVAYGWGANNQADWVGRVASTIGQDIAAAYGVSMANVKTQTKYQMVCGVWTASATNGIGVAASNPRLASTKYLLQTPQSGYLASAAANWCTHICVANYVAPSEKTSNQEISDAFNYVLNGVSTIPPAYIDTLNSGSTVDNIPGFIAAATAWKTWAQGGGGSGIAVNKMCCYEGGYSPDYQTGGASPTPTSTISGATSANPCVLTMNSTSFNGNTFSNASTPAAFVGAAITISGLGGTMGTLLNNPSSEVVTFTGGGSANINGANTLLLNQAVWFTADNANTGANLPAELTQVNLTGAGTQTSRPYYVVSTGNPFQISLTRGGTPITFAASGTNTIRAQEGWFISAVSGVSVSIDVNAGSATYTTSGTATYGGSPGNTYINRLRYAGKLVYSSPNMATGLQGYTALVYNNFAALSGGGFTAEFPSCFQLGGSTPSGNVWSVLEDIYQTPNPPQWLAFIAFNH